MKFQPMPELSPSEYSALRDNIKIRGILVPIVVDQRGNVLDGNNRLAIAAELGIECSREVRIVQDDDEAMDIAVELNCARRHLNQDQKRQLVAQEIQRRPGDSDRAIARALSVGCTPMQVMKSLTTASWRVAARDGVKLFPIYEVAVFNPLSEWLADDDAMASAHRHAIPADAAVRRLALDSIAQLGAA